MLPARYTARAENYFKEIRDKALKKKFLDAIEILRENTLAGQVKKHDLTGMTRSKQTAAEHTYIFLIGKFIRTYCFFSTFQEVIDWLKRVKDLSCFSGLTCFCS